MSRQHWYQSNTSILTINTRSRAFETLRDICYMESAPNYLITLVYITFYYGICYIKCAIDCWTLGCFWLHICFNWDTRSRGRITCPHWNVIYDNVVAFPSVRQAISTFTPPLHRKGAICDLMKFSPLSAPKVVRFTNFGAATASQGENFINITFRGCVTGSWSVDIVASLWKLTSASTTALPWHLLGLRPFLNCMRSYDMNHPHSMRPLINIRQSSDASRVRGDHDDLPACC